MRRREWLATIGLAASAGCLRFEGDSAETTTAGQSRGQRSPPNSRTNTASRSTTHQTAARNAQGTTRTSTTVDESPEPNTATQTKTPTETHTDTPTDTPTSTAKPLSITTDWPQYRFDAANTGWQSDGTGPTKEIGIRWTFQRQESVPDTRENTFEHAEFNPAIADGVAFLSSQDDNVYAINAETGEELWRFTDDTGITDDSRRCTPAISGDVVIAEGSGGHLYGLDRNSGEQQWVFRLPPNSFRKKPTVKDGTTYFVSEGNVYAVNASDGSLQWKQDGGNYALTVTTGGGRVYMYAMDGEENPVVYAADAATGEKLWTAEGPSIACAFADGTVYTGRKSGGQASTGAVDGQAKLLALDAETGTRNWETELSTSLGSESAPPAVAGETIFAGLHDGNVYAFDAESGEQQWMTKTRANLIQESPVVVNGHVYFGTYWGGWVYCVSAEDGTKRWSYPLSDNANQPAIVDNTVFIGDASGKLHALTEE